MRKSDVHLAMKEEEWRAGTLGKVGRREMSRGKGWEAGVKTEVTLPKNTQKSPWRFLSFLPADVYIREACEFG